MSLRVYVRTSVACFFLLVTAALIPVGLPMRLTAEAQGVVQALPQVALPQVYLDTTFTPPSGNTIAVPAGGDFQAALDNANPGDTIQLAAGASYIGPFTLPNKAGAGWIYIESSALSSLPAPGNRVSPSLAGLMPKILASGSAAIQTVSGAHQYRFVGIEFAPTPGLVSAPQFSMVHLGSGETDVQALPNNLVFDRCYIHGDPAAGAQRGILMDSASTAVIDSYLSDFKLTTSQALAIQSQNGPGPFKIVNNYLEGAGTGVGFGGWIPTIPNLVSSDVEIRGNYFARPLSWRVGDPAYAGTPWVVANFLQLTNAQRVLVDGNIFESNWKGGDQDGFALSLAPVDQNGGMPWATVQDITFTHNIVRHSTAGVHMGGWDNLYPSQQLQRVLIQNNLFTDIGAFAANGGSVGRLFQLRDGAANVVIDHNTAFQTESPLFAQVGTGAPNTGLVYTNDLTPNNQGVSGDGTAGNPPATLAGSFPGAVFAGNALVGGSSLDYPPNNFFPPTPADVGFVNYAGGDYRLAASSPYKNAGTDGKDVGADINAINAATANVISGATSAASPSPPVTLSFTPASQDFGSVAVGGSAYRSFMVTNLGGSAVSGAVSTTAPFSVAFGNLFVLGPGGSQMIVVGFSPTAARGYAALIDFTWNTGSSG